MEKPIWEDLKVKKRARVEGFKGSESIVARLVDLGIHPGVEIEYFQILPFGGPLIIRVETGFLALRQDEALCLILKS